MKINTFRWLGLGLAALVVGCSTPTSDSTTPAPTPVVPTPIEAPTALFRDATITTYIDGTTPSGQKGMIQDMGAGGGTTIDVSAVPAKATFAAYPNYWDGGIGWLMKPTASAGFYDLSSVKTIEFKIKSATILPTQLAVFIQWKSATSGLGGEFTLPLDTLGVTSLTDWNLVSIDVSSGGKIPDTITAARFGYGIENFFTGTGSTHIDTPLAIKWYGSAGANPNAGPLAAGQDYVIGDVRFLKADGTDASIASGISWPVVTTPTTVPTTPTATPVISLFNSSGTYTDTAMSGWQASWSTNASMTDDTTSVSGKTLKKLSFTDAGGYDGADITTPFDITGKTHLHLDYWTSSGTTFGVKVVDFGPNGHWDNNGDDTSVVANVATATQGAWTSVDLDVSTLTTMGHIAQLVFVANNGAAPQTFYLDNIYFH